MHLIIGNIKQIKTPYYTKYLFLHLVIYNCLSQYMSNSMLHALMWAYNKLLEEPYRSVDAHVV